MVRTRTGNGVENCLSEGLECSKIVHKRKYCRKFVVNHHNYSPLSAPQLTNPETGFLLANVLKHHGKGKLANSSEHAPRRAIHNCSSFQSKQEKSLEETQATASMHSCRMSPPSEDPKMHPLITAEQGRNLDVGDAIVPSEQESTPYVGDMTGGSHLLGTNLDPNSGVPTIGADNLTSEVNIVQEKMDRDHLIKRSASQSTKSLNMTEIAELMYVDDGDEVDSLACDSILVGGYRIRPQYADICNLILSKWGDIAAHCSGKLMLVKSFYIESLCVMVHKLQNTEFANISRKELEDMLAHLSYFEGEGVNVSWLKKLVQVIFEGNLAASLLRPSSDTKKSLQEKKSIIWKTKKDLEVYGKDYAIKEEELAKLKENIKAANDVLSKEGEAVKETEAMLLEYKAKLRYVYNEYKPLVQSLT